MKKFLPWILTIVILGGLGLWGYKAVTKPLPGEAVKEADGSPLSREHVTDIAEITYASNPPAGGEHFPIWAKPGIYDRFISDGYFIHSMEHGYVIIWYDCNKLVQTSGLRFYKEALAHEDEAFEDSTESGKPLMHMTAQVRAGTSWITPQNQPEVEVEFPESFKTDSCKYLVNQLFPEFTKVARKVIVVPKQGMETPIALTAWERILKLQNVDKGAIINFIKAFHNRGPEQTME
ncbi:DUF3105 domain-containing protein [Candidatus Woesebacteria bacterium]|nr:DUF3105 domain-containing protein [Candidatus Woesebacteria bacterium]